METKNFNEKIHKVLENEWGRVKKDEPWFKFTKWGVLVLFIGFLIFVRCIEFMKNIKINESNTSNN